MTTFGHRKAQLAGFWLGLGRLACPWGCSGQSKPQNDKICALKSVIGWLLAWLGQAGLAWDFSGRRKSQNNTWAPKSVIGWCLAGLGHAGLALGLLPAKGLDHILLFAWRLSLIEKKNWTKWSSFLDEFVWRKVSSEGETLDFGHSCFVPPSAVFRAMKPQ